MTKEAKNIATALGETSIYHVNKLIILDKCKTKVKKNPKNHENYDDYMNSLVPLQTLVLNHVSCIEKKLLTWENQFCLENKLAVPTEEDWDEEIRNLMEQLKYGKFMLKNAWKIKF